VGLGIGWASYSEKANKRQEGTKGISKRPSRSCLRLFHEFDGLGANAARIRMCKLSATLQAYNLIPIIDLAATTGGVLIADGTFRSKSAQEKNSFSHFFPA
jgi:hypothetical protein